MFRIDYDKIKTQNKIIRDELIKLAQQLDNYIYKEKLNKEKEKNLPKILDEDPILKGC